MSFGRTLANIVTLGLWSFTDPDIEEFWEDAKPTVTIRFTSKADKLVDRLFSENKGIKRPKDTGEKTSSVTEYRIEVDSHKVTDALCEWLQDNENEFLGNEGIRVEVHSFGWRTMVHKKTKKRLVLEDEATLCKEGGNYLRYGRAKNARCSKDNSKGFFVKQQLAKKHDYVYAEASRWGVSVHPSSSYEDAYDDDD